MDASHTIVVLAPRDADAHALIARIKQADAPVNEEYVPWTISNKYYTADVRFRVVSLAQWTPSVLSGIPATIFAFQRGEPYAQHVNNIAPHVEAAAPDVVLAVGLGSEPPHPDDPPEGPDAFFADAGFEYAEAAAPAAASISSTTADEDSEPGVGNLSRVIDALSTIMWPSMQRAAGSNKPPTLGQQIAMLDEGDLEGLDAGELDADLDEEQTLAALMADQPVPLPRAQARATQMAALERWLLENEDLYEREGAEGHDDDASTAAGDDALGQDNSYTREQSAFTSELAASLGTSRDPWAPRFSADATPVAETPPSRGFDDDFSAFVSAPAISVLSESSADPQVPSLSPTASMNIPAFSTSPLPESSSAGFLAPMRTGGSLHSLSSFGQDEIIDDATGWMALSETGSHFGDNSLRADLSELGDESSSHLAPGHSFEPGFSPFRPTRSLSDPLEDDPLDFGLPPAPAPAGVASSSIPGVRGVGAGEADVRDARAAFDLVDVLGALASVREGVQGLDDERARRDAAARFASEFVYGRIGDEA
ncbi:hypothetical protein PENSPDRAFT_648596 [Peniophora sp. CONT]|nr:hypothetical protein PENSPDRAFT_648596 [Peniophora sp. CONT]